MKHLKWKKGEAPAGATASTWAELVVDVLAVTGQTIQANDSSDVSWSDQARILKQMWQTLARLSDPRDARGQTFQLSHKRSDAVAAFGLPLQQGFPLQHAWPVVLTLQFRLPGMPGQPTQGEPSTRQGRKPIASRDCSSGPLIFKDRLNHCSSRLCSASKPNLGTQDECPCDRVGS